MSRPYNVVGSQDSTDVDIVVLATSAEMTLLPHQLLWAGEELAKSLASEFPDKPLDVNFVHVDEKTKHVLWASRGTPDGFNNLIWHTYMLHIEKQKYPCFVTSPVERDKEGEIRMLFTTIPKRIGNSKWLKLEDGQFENEPWRRLTRLKNLRVSAKIFRTGEEPGKYPKRFAHSLGILHALLSHNKEIFTKSEVIEYLPVLEPFLRRVKLADDDLRWGQLQETKEQVEQLIEEFLDNLQQQE